MIFNTAVKISQEVFKQWLLQFEYQEEIIEKDGKIYRFNMNSEKEFMTRFGKIIMSRRLYQQDHGDKTFVSLDAWSVEEQYASPEVREAILFMTALMTPSETEGCHKKTAMLHPDRTCIQNVIHKMEKTVYTMKSLLWKRYGTVTALRQIFGKFNDLPCNGFLSGICRRKSLVANDL